MRTWKDELHWYTRRAYYRGFIVGGLAGAALAAVLILGKHNAGL